MSQARKINDHSAWMGSRGKGYPLPEGPHKLKAESSAEGAGKLSQYEDTSEDIKRVQGMGDAKAKGHPMKPGYRY